MNAPRCAHCHREVYAPDYDPVAWGWLHTDDNRAECGYPRRSVAVPVAYDERGRLVSDS